MHIRRLLSFPLQTLFILSSYFQYPITEQKLSIRLQTSSLTNRIKHIKHIKDIVFKVDCLYLMENFVPASPAIDTLDVFEETTYAGTSTKTLRVLKFFLEDLKPVKAEDLDPEDCKCHICTEEFTADSHIAVRLPCNHYFGERCIQNWLRPYVPAHEAMNQEWEPAANTCPICRQVFFPEQKECDVLPHIATRIKLWDMVYARVGIVLSEKERQAREDLLRFLQRYRTRGYDEYYPAIADKPYIIWAQLNLLGFCRLLEEKTLNPVQEVLRAKLMWVASYDCELRHQHMP